VGDGWGASAFDSCARVERWASRTARAAEQRRFGGKETRWKLNAALMVRCAQRCWRKRWWMVVVEGDDGDDDDDDDEGVMFTGIRRF
jgi:hypothetical protein